MQIITSGSFPLVLLHNYLNISGQPTQVIPDISQIFYIAQREQITAIYTSLSAINEQLIRCSQQYGFKIYGVVDSSLPCSLPLSKDDIIVLAIGGDQSEAFAKKLAGPCEVQVLKMLYPLESSRPINTSGKSAVYHYVDPQHNLPYIINYLANVPNTYVFGLPNNIYPLENNFGLLDVQSFMTMCNNISFLICFDPIAAGLTPPQIYLSRNVLCLCDAQSDVKSLADFPCFQNGDHLVELIKEYSSNTDLLKQTIANINEQLEKL